MKFRRPTMGDRMDNAVERRRPWQATAVIREEAIAQNRRVRRALRNYENTKPYRGSETEAEHRRNG